MTPEAANSFESPPFLSVSTGEERTRASSSRRRELKSEKLRL
ncbi:hypothetical protein AtNW77_Chr5g0086731 [Arabidopsis thaliana]